MFAYLKALSNAFAFLSILPVPWYPDVLGKNDGFKASVAFFSWVGLALGLVLSASVFILEKLLFRLSAGYISAELSHFFSALILSLLIGLLLFILTRALHFDACADVLDAYWGGSTPEERIKILKDEHIGSFALGGLFFFFSISWMLVSILIMKAVLWPRLCLILSYSRALVSFIAYQNHTTATQGLAQACMHKARPAEFIITVMPCVFSLGLFYLYTPISKLSELLYMPIALVFTTAVAQLVLHRLKVKFAGVNGDIMGCVLCISEFCLVLSCVLV